MDNPLKATIDKVIIKVTIAMGIQAIKENPLTITTNKVRGNTIITEVITKDKQSTQMLLVIAIP